MCHCPAGKAAAPVTLLPMPLPSRRPCNQKSFSKHCLTEAAHSSGAPACRVSICTGRATWVAAQDHSELCRRPADPSCWCHKGCLAARWRQQEEQLAAEGFQHIAGGSAAHATAQWDPLDTEGLALGACCLLLAEEQAHAPGSRLQGATQCKAAAPMRGPALKGWDWVPAWQVKQKGRHMHHWLPVPAQNWVSSTITRLVAEMEACQPCASTCCRRPAPSRGQRGCSGVVVNDKAAARPDAAAQKVLQRRSNKHPLRTLTRDRQMATSTECPAALYMSRVAWAAMPMQFFAGSSERRPPSPVMCSIERVPGVPGTTLAVTRSPMPCMQ